MKFCKHCSNVSTTMDAVQCLKLPAQAPARSDSGHLPSTGSPAAAAGDTALAASTQAPGPAHDSSILPGADPALMSTLEREPAVAPDATVARSMSGGGRDSSDAAGPRQRHWLAEGSGGGIGSGSGGGGPAAPDTGGAASGAEAGGSAGAGETGLGEATDDAAAAEAEQAGAAAPQPVASAAGARDTSPAGSGGASAAAAAAAAPALPVPATAAGTLTAEAAAPAPAAADASAAQPPELPATGPPAAGSLPPQSPTAEDAEVPSFMEEALGRRAELETAVALGSTEMSSTDLVSDHV